MNGEAWPELDMERDSPTLAVPHLTSQMLGKIRVAHAPWVNHGWHATLRPAAAGLMTLPTYAGDGRTFTLTLDFCVHGVALAISDGVTDVIPFAGRTTAAIHRGLIEMLARHQLPSRFHCWASTPAEAGAQSGEAAP